MDGVAKREEEGRAERKAKGERTGSLFVSYTSFCVC